MVAFPCGASYAWLSFRAPFVWGFLFLFFRLPFCLLEYGTNMMKRALCGMVMVGGGDGDGVGVGI